jgi:Flp pilus assembly protein TadD
VASAAAYETARGMGSRDRRLFAELASVYDVGQRYDQAIAVYQDWLKTTPDDAEMQHQLGLTLVLQNRAKDGVVYLEKAYQLAPNEPELRLDLGFGLLQAGQLDSAATHLEALLKAAASDERVAAVRHFALQFLAQVRAGQGRTKEALVLLDQAIDAGRTDPNPVRLRAQLRVLTGDQEGALADYQLLVRANPDDAGALVGAAGALLALNRLDEAATAVDKARALIGEQPQITFRQAQLAWRRGDRTAVAHIVAYADAHPTALEAWRELLTAAEATGDAKLKKRAKARVAELER